MGEIKIGELKTKILLRVFFEISMFEKLTDEKFERSIIFQTNHLLKELGFESIIVRKFRDKIFMINTPNGRIICQIGIDGRDIQFVNLRGLISESSDFGSIVESIAKLGIRPKKG